MNLTPIATITTDDDGIHVQVMWEGGELDRRYGYGWGFSANKMALAKRLVRAINAGVVFSTPTINTDVNGNTYAFAASNVRGRCANADLRALGF